MSDAAEATVPGERERGRQRSILDAAPLFTFILVGAMASRLIQDSSFLWHIRAGTLQRDLVSVVSSDPFSYTRLGEEWRTQSWLAELLYAWLEGTFDGYAWVNWMVFVVGTITAALVAVSLRKPAKSPLGVAIALIPVLWLMAPFLRPRPVVFSFLLLAALVVALQNRQSLVWVIIPIIWLWAGVHGSWVIGGALIVLEVIRTMDRKLLYAGLLAALSTLATAHGIGTWLVLLSFRNAGEALDVLVEWQTPNFTSLLQGPYLLLVLGILVAAIQGRIKLRDLVVILPFLALGMSANRSVVPAVIVLAPWAALAIPEMSVPRRVKSPVVVGAVWVLAGVFALLPMFARPLGAFDGDRFPSAETLALMDDRDVFYSDVTGGYLIFAEGPEQLVFIDDRAELYGGEYFLDYLDAVDGAYEEMFAEYGFDAALTEKEWLLTDRLERDGWTRVAEEEELVLLYAP